MRQYRTYTDLDNSFDNIRKQQMMVEPYAAAYTPIQDIPLEQPPQRGIRRNLVRSLPRFKEEEDAWMNHHSREYNPPQPQPIVMEERDDCMMAQQHINACRQCSRLYRRNQNQMMLIIFLVFIILMLLTRLMD